MKRKAYAVWKGGIINGSGTISSDSGVLSNTQYSFSSRFENGIGTNPEELIAAAHSGSSLWLSPDSWRPQSSPQKASIQQQLSLLKNRAMDLQSLPFILTSRPRYPGHPLKRSIWQLKKQKRDVLCPKYLMPKSLWMLCWSPDISGRLQDQLPHLKGEKTWKGKEYTRALLS